MERQLREPHNQEGCTEVPTEPECNEVPESGVGPVQAREFEMREKEQGKIWRHEQQQTYRREIELMISVIRLSNGTDKIPDPKDLKGVREKAIKKISSLVEKLD